MSCCAVPLGAALLVGGSNVNSKMANYDLNATGRDIDATIYARLQEKVPETLVYKLPKRGLTGSRTMVKLRPENQTYTSNQNKQIRFLLPNNTIFDFRYAYLEFTFSIAATGGSYYRIAQGIWSMFQRLRIRYGSVDIEDSREWGRLFSWLFQIAVPNLVATNLGVTDMGIGTQAQRNAQGGNNSGTTCTVYMPIWSGIFNSIFVPFQALAGGLWMELFLDDAVNFVETDGTNPIVTVSNLILHCERLDLDNDYQKKVISYVRANGFEFAYNAWDCYQNSLNTGTQQQITINNKSSSVNAYVNYFRLTTSIANPLVNDKYVTFPYQPLGLLQYNILINSNVYPDEPILINVSGNGGAHGYEAAQMMYRYLNKWKTNAMIAIAPPVPIQYYADALGLSDMFIFFIDMSTYPQDPDLVNSFTTLLNQSTTILMMKFPAAIPANYELNTWIEYFKVAKIRSDGSVMVVQ
jgi:hypothetical protein